ncbi:hypothetical protein BJX76DRAFT_315397 [Aspergillus varians]
MSNQPIPPAPPYWGPSNYTQQWTPQPPSSVPMPPSLHFNPDSSSTPQQYHNFEGFYANANLPGLGGASATGTFPPPPFAFPGAFPPPGAPPPFAMPHMGYPLMPGPLPSAPSHLPHRQPSANDLINPTHPNAVDSQPMTTTSSKQDLDREEGELTDIEGPATTEQHGSQSNARRGNAFGSRKYHIGGNAKDSGLQMEQTQATTSNGFDTKHDRHSAIVATNRRESLPSEIEEGEASPEPRTSSRDSGSPYNPPMPTTAGSPSIPKSLPEAFQPTGEGIGTLNPPTPTPTDLQASPGSGLPLAQLRVQAQGALLSLAPHSIRYTELVGEGINPTILKQLYEEVGIKVPTAPPVDLQSRAGSSENDHPGVGPSAVNGQAKQLTQQLEPQSTAAQKPTPIELSPTPPQSTQANTAKPMERKEVIARMLAAKAAKSSPAPTPNQPDAGQTPPSSQAVPETVEKSTTLSPSRDTSSNEKESRVREKNRAQTELARKRIEQLKKQGLMRNLSKLPSESQLPEKEPQDLTEKSPQVQASTIVQHPLPERPPLPESTSLDQIPGLFMADQASEGTNGSQVTPVQDLVLKSAPHPRSSQRKRPRASDFDEPIPVPKRTFSNGTNHVPPGRLVIDISDDEFYGDDEDGSIRAETTFTDIGGLGVHQLSTDSIPHRPATSQSQGFSVSSTPSNLKNSEQEDLRRKDLEIQAMHRRIAELEQRKKAKLASRTQSPRADLSPPEFVSMPAMFVPSIPNITGKNAENVLAPIDADGLRRMKSKLLRMQEIEAGVPSLDAEIQKSEAKLADTRREEVKLSSELAKGKEGRRQLLEELNALRLEVSGLSLDHVNAALISMEVKEEMPVEVVQGMLRILSIPGLQHSRTTTYNQYAIAPGYENDPSDECASAVPEVPEADVQAQEDTPFPQHAIPAASTPRSAENLSGAHNVAKDTPVLNSVAEESSDTSMSEDSSSAMDESTDDSSSDSGSVNEEMPDAPDLNTNPVAPVDEMATTTPELPNGTGAPQVKDAPLSETQNPKTPPQTEILPNASESLVEESENIVSPASPASEAYEPPEPEESNSASDSSYSPAPSPDFPSPTTNMEVSGSSEDQSQEAGEPLTEKFQELDFQQPSQNLQIGFLDNARRPEDSRRKFSPYTSPLKLFKAYRYHPNYNDNVSGGYRSLTYSHNIDPLKYLCPFETSGGVCNDRSCEYQHFRDMALSDDKILVQMGSLREGKTLEECDKYVAGLKETINDMRRDKVKDMNTVATEIAAYRRRFLQDDTRVLAL